MARWSRRTLLSRSASTALVVGCGASTDLAVDSGAPPEETGTSGPVNPGLTCELTGSDIEGPFWVPGVPVRQDLDLYGDPGPKLELEGVVRDADTCDPVPDAVVEIWHADPDGGYDEAADGKYRGQTRSDSEGRYRFSTLVPGRYLNGDQFRPAHVHVKVWIDGEERLTTQLYFDNDPYNDIDPWFDGDRVAGDLDDGAEIVGTIDLTV